MDFQAFPKIARLSREMIITEKIDGTNGVIAISEFGDFCVGSRNKWIVKLNADNENCMEDVPDNAGFRAWAVANKDSLMNLGVGYHYGEWWGKGIQRGYDLSEKRFSLFNVSRWNWDNIPECCDVVPTLYIGNFDTAPVSVALSTLERLGSAAAPGYMNPEGVVVFHTAGGYLFKKTIKNDESPKGAA